MTLATPDNAPGQTPGGILDGPIRIVTVFLSSLSAAVVLVGAEAHWAHVPVAVDAQSSILLAEM